MNYDLIKQLVNLAEKFELSAGPAPDLAAFSAWLYAQTHPGPRQGGQAHYPSPAPMHETLESVITKLVIFMYRYAKGYLKKALDGTALQTVDEFVYLTALLHRPGLTKIELIELNLHEKTSGMEIIKRLLARGLVQQQEGESDRRSKQLYITEIGRTVLLPIFERMHQVSQLVSGNLAEEEKQQLVSLLHKLNDFHHPIFANEKQTSWGEVFAKYIGQQG
jgi:MarR family transcriptional regulator, lower aerobic nicotinate degradation pathway regulator